jgi:hypothetical protein
MSKRERRERLPLFVPLLKSTLGSPAWRAMSHGAQGGSRTPHVATSEAGNRRGLLGAESVMADIFTPFPNVAAAEEPR